MKAATFVFLLGVALAILFVAFPGIDLYASGLLYSDSGGFILRGHPAALFMNNTVNFTAKVVSIFLVVGFALSLVRKRRTFGLRRVQYLFLIVCLILGPLLVVNVILKNHWDRARPKQIVEFGGTKKFTPAFIIADQCETNCSFVSGDASFGYFAFAVALLARRRRRTLAAVGITVGTLVGIERMLQGAHFLSDVIFAGIFTILIALLLEPLILGGGWRSLARAAGVGLAQPPPTDIKDI